MGTPSESVIKALLRKRRRARTRHLIATGSKARWVPKVPTLHYVAVSPVIGDSLDDISVVRKPHNAVAVVTSRSYSRIGHVVLLACQHAITQQT